MRSAADRLNGVINVYKEQGVTSSHVVAQVRSILKVRKAGHIGTLDPIAEGVLPVCLGFATKFAELLTAKNKQYIARFRLGVAFDTFDTTGAVLCTSDVRPDEAEIHSVLENLTGEPELTVPAFSAKKINGNRAYDLARKGKITNAGTASMKICKIELIAYDYPEGVFVIDCGKGTYVRSVIHELGKKLGSYAAMSGLIRSCNGAFHMKSANKLSDIKRLADEGREMELIIPIQDNLNLPKAVVKQAAVKAVINGISPAAADYVSLPDTDSCEQCLLFTKEGHLLALGNTRNNPSVPIKLLKVIGSECYNHNLR